jgi:V-type H+-transporting ATPase subunit E
MAGKEDNKQIKQMVNFIMQEAHEKVSEIKIKTDHDFNLEKQNLVHNGKLKLQEEYAQKEKDMEVNQRVQLSSAVGAARVTKMKSRDDLLEALKKETLVKLGAFCKTSEYPAFLTKLIVQGLVKIEEPIVEVQCRPEDKAIVTTILPAAVAQFKALMNAAGHNVKPQVTLSTNQLSSKAINGGICLTACNNRIILDQTVDERLRITYMDVMPSVRHGLFTGST